MTSFCFRSWPDTGHTRAAEHRHTSEVCVNRTVYTFIYTVPVATSSGCNYCFRVEITSALSAGNESQFLRKRLLMSHYWYWRLLF